MSASLASLLEQSRQLTNNLQSGRDIPHVELGLDQIESASRRLGAQYGSSTVGGRMAVDGAEEGAWVRASSIRLEENLPKLM